MGGGVCTGRRKGGASGVRAERSVLVGQRSLTALLQPISSLVSSFPEKPGIGGEFLLMINTD